MTPPKAEAELLRKEEFAMETVLWESTRKAPPEVAELEANSHSAMRVVPLREVMMTPPLGLWFLEKTEWDIWRSPLKLANMLEPGRPMKPSPLTLATVSEAAGLVVKKAGRRQPCLVPQM